MIARLVLIVATMLVADSAAAQSRLVQRSSPPGFVDEDALVPNGQAATVVAIASAGEMRFVEWVFSSFPPNGTPCTGPAISVAEIPTRDALGRSRNPVHFQLLQNTCAIAVFAPRVTDSDSDLLPDHFERQFFGDLSPVPSTDDDLPVPDSIPAGVEEAVDLHPRLADAFDAGGISAGTGALDWLVLDPNVFFYNETSVPLGAVTPRRLPLVAGTIVGSASAPEDFYLHRFTAWHIDGVPAYDVLGTAANPVRVTMSENVDAVARYTRGEADIDGDGIADWFEERYWGGLAPDGSGDIDGDGIVDALEYSAGTPPHVRDVFAPGGVSAGMTRSMTLPLTPLWDYLIRSEPPNLVVTSSGSVPDGTVVATPIADRSSADRQFAFWALNGSRQVDPIGAPLLQVDTVVAGSGVEFVARYVLKDEDADADELPDWFELGWFGDLSASPDADPDGDGLTLRIEEAAGLHPRDRDMFIAGGMSGGVSLPTFIDLRPFPRVREVLVGGLPASFFSTTPDAAGMSGAAFGLDANTTTALGDWDGDGDPDVFVAGVFGGAPVFRVYRNGGSSVVLDLEREVPLETALGASLAGIATPALSLGDVDMDGRADLAIGGNSGTVKVLKSPGGFSASPSTLATIATGDASAIPGFADTSGDNRPELIVLRPDGTARAYTHSGNDNAPYSDAVFTSNALPGNVLQATSVSSADITEDGNPDIVISDATGSLWEFHRQLGGGHQLISRIFGGTFNGYANRLAGAVGDLDGDGDGDVIAGFAEGGLVYLRNQVQKLTIEPTVKTLVSGQGQTFTLRDPGPPQGPVGPITWRFVSNRSGGTLSPTGVYASGAQSRRVDIIEAEDARGVTGRTYVNVIDAADQTQVGKVLIVAGGKATNDAIWAATRTTANRMYRAFLHRGYRKEDIRYLTLAYGEALEPADRQSPNDLDGNGIANDELYGLPLQTNVEQSLTQWAATAADLVVVLIDHGDNQVFTLKGTETLAASTLDGWLDALQGGATDVTVIMDYCFAGSFLPALSTPAGKQRILLAASAANERSSLFQGGEVSFSQGVARGIFQGFDLERTFRQAAETMAAHQSGQLDDNGSGAYDLADGAIARQKTLGPIFVVGQDIPVIEAVSATVPSPAGVSEISTIGAEGSSGVISVHPLARVWCTVEAPNARSDPAQPLANLPEVPLVLDLETRTYKARVEGFTDAGTYQVSCYVRDIHNSVSFPATTQVVRAAAHDARLVIVVAGETNAPEWASARAIGDATYQTARARGYLPGQIYYLTRGSAAQSNACTSACTPTSANLSAALSTYLATDVGAGTPSASEVTLVLIGSGGTGALQLGTGDALDANQLDTWLDAFQDAQPMPRPVNVIVDHGEDACNGQGAAFNLTSPATCPGTSLIARLAPQGNEARRDRAVFVSSGAGQPNVRLANGTLSFAQLILSHALENRAFGDTLQTARGTLDLVTRPSGVVQRPYFDVTSAASLGNPGTPNEARDLAELRYRFLGGLIRTTAPRTVGMPSLQGPVGSPITIHVKSNGSTTRTLQAFITAPNDPGRPTVPRQVTAQTLALAYNATTDRYEAQYTPTIAGTHAITIVETTNGLNSVPQELTLVANGTAAGVSLASAMQTVAEGQTLTITATLSQPAAQSVAVPFTLTGSAALQVDYDVDALQFVFAAGQASRTVVLDAATDALAEPDETLVLALGEAENVTVSPPTETRITITNVGGTPPGNAIFLDGFE